MSSEQDLQHTLRQLEIEVRALKLWKAEVGSLNGIRAGSIVGAIPPGSGGTGLTGDALGSVQPWTNDSGGVRNQGTVVIRKGNRTFDVTATVDSEDVIGVLDSTAIAVAAEGRIRQQGYQSVVFVQGNVAAGHYLRTSATAGRAEDAGATASPSSFAIALSAYGGGGAGSVAAFIDPGFRETLLTRDPLTLLSLILSQSLTLTVGASQTIAAGVITAPDAVQFTIDTEAGAAVDDLDTINGGADGRIIILRPASDTHTVVLKHGTGNLQIVGNADVSLDDDHDWAWALYVGASWYVFAVGGAGAHNLFSVTHSDTDPAAPADQDLAQYDSGAGQWKHLPAASHGAHGTAAGDDILALAYATAF